MSGRRDLQLNSLLGVALVAALAVACNYLSIDSFVRIDLTEDDEFTLSSSARTIVSSLDAPVTIEVFLSKDLPSQFALHTQRIRDKLAEFEAVATVPFTVTYTDPDDDRDARDRARRLGVEPRETSARSRGKVESQITWLGLSIHHKDGSSALPFIDSTSTLEYDLASALRTLSTGGVRKVLAFATGQGEPDMAAVLEAEQHPLRPIALVLADTYELRTADLTASQEIDADVDVLIVMGSRAPLAEQALFAIDQFAMRGGAVGLFPYAALPDVESRQVQPAPTSFTALTEPWGVTFGSDLVVDREMNGVIRLPITLRTRQGNQRMMQPVSSPLVPLLQDLDRAHPITRRIETLVAPFACALDVSAAATDADVQVSVLAATRAEATVGAVVRSLDPRALVNIQETEVPGPHVVLVALAGSLDSGWAGRSAPDGIGFPGIDRSPEGTRVIIGSSFEMPFANPGLLLAAVDWMAADEVLLGIRPRMSAPALLEMPEHASWLRVANVAGLPALVALFGIVRLRRRRRRGAT